MKTLLFLFLLLSSAVSTAEDLGQITLNDPVLGMRTITYEKINGYAVVEGDILLAHLKGLERQGAIITNKIGGSRWPEGVVPFEINEDMPLVSKIAIYQAIDHWKKNSPIEFVELTSKNRDRYPDFISFIPAQDTSCSSYVGRQGGMQEILLGARCTNMNIVHELGHALGLWHEQSRADRAQYVSIIWKNIDEKHKHNFNQHLSDSKDVGDYDYDSIMHYPEYAFSKNGEKTILPLKEGVTIGQRNHLSKNDIAAIKNMYPQI